MMNKFLAAKRRLKRRNECYKIRKVMHKINFKTIGRKCLLFLKTRSNSRSESLSHKIF
jgi:hypothetical protein